MKKNGLCTTRPKTELRGLLYPTVNDALFSTCTYNICRSFAKELSPPYVKRSANSIEPEWNKREEEWP